MLKQILPRATKISILFAVAFFHHKLYRYGKT